MAGLTDPLDATPSGLERNLRRYPWWTAAQSALFWQPVFILWFSEHLSPGQVLRLEAIYYVVVVFLEVPTGWASDRIGRRPLLVASSMCWGLGAATIALGSDWSVLACGQALLAAAMAMGSGTDSSLHADSLLALGRLDELEVREARARSFSLAALAVAGAVGGLAGTVHLALPYALSAVAGLLAAGLALTFEEPPHTEQVSGPPPFTDPVLRWVLAYTAVLTVLIHIPYELLQPWLDQLPVLGSTPVIAGTLIGVAMGAGAVAARWSPQLHRRVGTGPLLLGSLGLQVGVIAAMGLAVHPLLIPILALRSMPTGLADPVIMSLVHPRLDSRVRATWLSIQSLVGRLAFAGSLAGVSLLLGDSAGDGWSTQAIATTTLPFVLGGAVAVVLLGVSMPRVGPAR